MTTERPMRFRAPKLVGGVLCLDFANSLYWRASPTPFEWLSSYSELIRWAQAVDLIDAKTHKQLSILADQHPAQAARVLTKAIEVRELIYEIFSPFVDGLLPSDSDIDRLNALIAMYSQHRQLESSSDRFRWGWRESGSHLDSVLWPIVQSAGELLASDEVTRVGQCPGDDCGWLFVDRSRRKNRRWCDMNDCGHRHNAKISYRRTRK